MTARERSLPPLEVVDASTQRGLLLAAREDLLAHATQVRNRLYADLVVLAPGHGAWIRNL